MEYNFPLNGNNVSEREVVILHRAILVTLVMRYTRKVAFLNSHAMMDSGANQGLYSAFRRVMYLMQFRQAVLVISYRRQSIHLREKNIAGPTERSKDAQHLASSQGRTCVFR